jgi:hypothetical protein
MEQALANSIRKSVTVEASQEHAFTVFTHGWSTWWPTGTHHSGDSPPVESGIEPFAEGRCWERTADGAESVWGKVLVWEPHDRVVLGWQLNEDFKYDPDFITEVEIRFVPESDSRTRVELEHRDLERYGEAQQRLTEIINSENGWTGLLQRYAEKASA